MAGNLELQQVVEVDSESEPFELCDPLEPENPSEFDVEEVGDEAIVDDSVWQTMVNVCFQSFR